MPKQWTANELRASFLDYFKRRGHTEIASSSLVPDDPTLLFTNAGMVQFKRAFLGLEKINCARAATVQKCMRVSGKHNDLENVGPSPRHHTFFEMLGNFSFGDYFKREATHFAWELTTKVWGVDPERWVITVHQSDPDAAKYWNEIPDVRKDRILPMGDKTNLWSMGDTGPCGYTSELHYDWGLERCTCKNPNCSVALDNDCPRWLEVWNLVFMQFNQDESDKRTLLPKPGVDTGMGLERIAAILQDSPSNYETDLFQPIFKKTRELLGHSEAQMNAQYIPYRVIADHGRAMTFLLADGVLPSNEKHGYVLRMVMRRAIRFGKKLGFSNSFLGEIAKTVIAQMGNHYKELNERQESILKALSQEEERFDRTLGEGLARLADLMDSLEKQEKKLIPGAEVFRLHDTYGFPFELTVDVARERNFTVDRLGYEQEMEKQRERSRGSTTGSAKVDARKKISISAPVTKFKGHEKMQLESTLVAHEGEIFAFDESPFYAEGGGQVGDTGSVENLSRPGRAEVLDTQQSEQGLHLHRVKITQGSFEIGDTCKLIVNVERRQRTQRNHTATHILHAALRQILGYAQGIQAGSLVAPNELRFDFTHFGPLKPEEIKKIEALSNRIVLQDLPVLVRHDKLEDAKSHGAMALFNEDYQDKEQVRVVQIGDEKPFSIELCGGTHVSRTGEIGGIKIIGEEGIAAGVRRVQVAVGEKLLDYVEERQTQLSRVAQLLKATEKELISKTEALLRERDQLRTDLDSLKREWLAAKKETLLAQKQSVNGIALVKARIDLDMEALKLLADMLEPQIGQGAIILGGAQQGKVALVCKVSSSLVKKLNAGEIVKAMTAAVKGGGGGSPQFAQGGGTDPSKLDDALNIGETLIRDKARV
jgi:alanyl-tRNA synthetase